MGVGKHRRERYLETRVGGGCVTMVVCKGILQPHMGLWESSVRSRCQVLCRSTDTREKYVEKITFFEEREP